MRIAGTREPPRRGTAAVPDGRPYHDPLPDRVGQVVHDHHWLLAGSAVLGGALGARFGTGVVAKSALALLGAAAAPAAAIGVGMLANRYFGGLDTEATGTAAASTGTRSARTPKAPRTNEHVRVMTFNVREGIGPRGTHTISADQLQQVAASIKREHPDVVMLQEVSDFGMLSGWHDQIAQLQSALRPDSIAFAPAGVRATGKASGNLVMTFNGFTIDDAQALRHPDVHGDGSAGVLRRIASLYGAFNDTSRGPLKANDKRFAGYFPRVTVDTIIDTPAGNELRVLATHLTGGLPLPTASPGGSPTQTPQIDGLAQTLHAWSGPTLLAGDFNVRPGTDEWKREVSVLGQAGLADAFTAAGFAPDDLATVTFPGAGNIDRVYSSRHFSVDAIRVSSGTRTSDHLPVVADLSLHADAPADRGPLTTNGAPPP